MTMPSIESFRIFAGWDRRQPEAAEVFKFSVERNASCEVDVQFLKIHEMPFGLTRQGATEFTYTRFMVPRRCGFDGRALFADGCDQLCLGDVAELAAMPMEKPIYVVKHSPVKMVPRERPRSWTSLMLLDCARCRFWTPEVVWTAPDERLMRLRDFDDDEIGSLPEEWNALCPVLGEPPAGAKIAHWSALADPNIGPWIDASGSAVWAGWRGKWQAATNE